MTGTDNINRFDIETQTDKLANMDLNALKIENAQTYKASHDTVTEAITLKRAEAKIPAIMDNKTAVIELRKQANDVQNTSADSQKAVELRTMADYIDMLEKYETALRNLADKHAEIDKTICTSTSEEGKKLLEDVKTKITVVPPSVPPAPIATTPTTTPTTPVASASAQPVVAAAPVEEPRHTYVVRKGDTLTSIARKEAKIPLSELKKLNPQIEDPNKIKIGQEIILPKTTPITAEINPKTIEYTKEAQAEFKKLGITLEKNPQGQLQIKFSDDKNHFVAITTGSVTVSDTTDTPVRLFGSNPINIDFKEGTFILTNKDGRTQKIMIDCTPSTASTTTPTITGALLASTTYNSLR